MTGSMSSMTPQRLVRRNCCKRSASKGSLGKSCLPSSVNHGSWLLEETSKMRSFFQSLLAFVTLGMLPLGCNRPGTPATPPDAGPRDVTLLVPAMN